MRVKSSIRTTATETHDTEQAMRASTQCTILVAAKVLFLVRLGTIAMSLHAGSTIGFSDASYVADETFDYVPILVQRTGDEGTSVTVVFATSDGTATAGEDYEPRHFTLEILVGETDKVVRIPILQDGALEPLETFRVSLTNPSAGAILGQRPEAAVNVKDNDKGLQLAMNAYSVNEDAGAIVLEVVRWDDGDAPVAVDWEIEPLTAVAGEDYVADSGTVTVEPGRVVQAFTIPIVNDAEAEVAERFRVTLINPSDGAALGTPVSALITITDTDQAVSFATESLKVREDAAFLELAITRGESEEPGSVLVSTVDGNAIAGEDFAALNSRVHFEAGEQLKRLQVPLIADAVSEANETFTVQLSEPAGAAVLGDARSLTVRILDDDGGVSFEGLNVTVIGAPPSVTLLVMRGNDLNVGPFSVHFETFDLSAVAGVDYEPVSGTLGFGRGETVKSIVVPLLSNPQATAQRTFRVFLSDLTGDGVFGRYRNATVRLEPPSAGSYVTMAPPFEDGLAFGSGPNGRILTWRGAGRLFRADAIDGPWLEVRGAGSPYPARSLTGTAFFRLTRPRPAEVFVPSGYDGATPMPLLLVLHGYSGSAEQMREVYRFESLAESYGFLVCHPEGTIDITGNRFFANANEACCDWYQSGVDDSTYLRELIEEICRRFRVDPKRVLATGASNGANMVHRMASDHADLIGAIASVGGMTFLEPGKCQPSEPVNILHIHGSADDVLPYDGGYLNRILPGPPQPPVPGTPRSFSTWGQANGCAGLIIDPERTMDLDLAVAGLDASVTRYMEHPPGGAVELWTIHGGWHAPTIYQGSSSSELPMRIVEWLLAHPKP